MNYRIGLLLLLISSSLFSAEPGSSADQMPRNLPGIPLHAELDSRALDLVTEGKFPEAVECFQKAAHAGSLTSAVLLLRGYNTGNLLVAACHEKAKEYSALFDYNKKVRLGKSPADIALLSSPTASIESSLDQAVSNAATHYEEIVTQVYESRMRPLYEQKYPWYSALCAVVQPHCNFLDRVLYPRGASNAPAPEDMVQVGLNCMRWDRIKPSELSLLEQAIRDLNSPAVFDKMAQMIKDSWMATTNKKELQKKLIQMMPLAAQQERAEQIRGYFEGAVYNSWTAYRYDAKDPETREAAFAEYRKSISLYFERCPQHARKLWKKFMEEKEGLFEGAESHPSNNSVRHALECLLILKRYRPHSFTRKARHYVEKSFPGVMFAVLRNQDLAPECNDTPFAVEALVEKAFQETTTLQKRNHPGYGALVEFLRLGAPLHARYQQRLEPLLPTLLERSPWAFDVLIKCAKDRSNVFRDKALPALVKYVVTLERDCMKEFDIDKLLTKILDQYPELYDKPVIEGYESLYQVAKAHGDDYTVQRLWLHCLKKEDAESFAWMRNSVCDYLNLEQAKGSQEEWAKISPMIFLNGSLQHASRENKVSLPRMRAFIKTADTTKLAESIYRDFLDSFKMRTLTSEETPLDERAAFLDTMAMTRCNQSLSDLSATVNALPESPFKQHADIVLQLLTKQMSWYESCALKRKLLELARQYPGLVGCPEVIRARCGALHNAYEWSCFDREEEILNTALTVPASYEGPWLLQYVRRDRNRYSTSDYYRLYACDKESGHACWAAPFTVKEPKQYHVFNNNVLCLTDEGALVELDSKTGMPLSSSFFSTLAPVEHFCVTPKGLVYALTGKDIESFDTVAQQRFIMRIPTQYATVEELVPVGERIACYDQNDNVLLIGDKTGTWFTVPVPDSFHSITIVGNDTKVIYAHEASLTCVNPHNGVVEWTYLLPNKYSHTLYLSSDGNTLFLSGDDGIRALSVSDTKNQPQVLWHSKPLSSLDIMMTKVNHLIVSPGGTLLYGWHSSYSTLFALDTRTGAIVHQPTKISLTECLPMLKQFVTDIRSRL